MKKLTCTFLVTLATLQLAAAADGTANTPAPQAPAASANASASAEDGGEKPKGTIELKNKSSFGLENGSRNPFWPIGWKPAPKLTNNPADQQTGPDISPTAFAVSSIMMGNGSRFAIINGKPMQEGQVFGLQMGTQVYQITVKTIEDGQVILLRRDQEFAVPLRRK